MKKLFSLLTITAAAMTMFTGCGTEKSSDNQTKLTLSATPLTIDIDDEGMFM